MGSFGGYAAFDGAVHVPTVTPVPPSPHQFLFPQFNTAANRPLGLRTNVRITPPDTQPFPSLVGKEAQIIGVEDGNQYLIKLRDGSTVKLHRMSLQPADEEAGRGGTERHGRHGRHGGHGRHGRHVGYAGRYDGHGPG